mmetsp:Transcript_12189/g.21153  ORF Transcript_12189/g.21153 Transcript_12189/m.21153 type:complete len:160 (-) Transcript_12189:511-990(-)
MLSAPSFRNISKNQCSLPPSLSLFFHNATQPFSFLRASTTRSSSRRWARWGRRGECSSWQQQRDSLIGPVSLSRFPQPHPAPLVLEGIRYQKFELKMDEKRALEHSCAHLSVYFSLPSCHIVSAAKHPLHERLFYARGPHHFLGAAGPNGEPGLLGRLR